MSRINTNIAALNTQRMLASSNMQFSRTVGRLSSGFRINRAADDAAGLGISNSLSGKIRGMTAASRNAEQANALLQVAEGGGQQIQAILERMKELAVQSASDNSDSNARTLLNNEFTQLKSEITRITDTTKFQGQQLLAGGGDVQSASGGTIATNNAEVVGGLGGVTLDASVADGTYYVSQDNASVSMSNGTTFQTLSGLSAGAQTLDFSEYGISFDVDSAFSVTNGSETFTEVTDVAGNLSTGDTVVVSTAAGTFNGDFIVSDSGTVADDTVTLTALDMTLGALSLSASAVDSSTNAKTAITAIDSAINTVSAEFGKIGAAQNRLDFAKANVDAAIENFSAAQSVIRDADIAAEATELSRLQILQQAATSVLAQANSAPQGVLSLLR